MTNTDLGAKADELVKRILKENKLTPPKAFLHVWEGSPNNPGVITFPRDREKREVLHMGKSEVLSFFDGTNALYKRADGEDIPPGLNAVVVYYYDQR